jgi:hypothetical protein
MMRGALLVVLAATLAEASAVELRSTPRAVQGVLSMSDRSGRVIADGELTQEIHGDELVARVRWRFGDGRRVEEVDTFALRPVLAQRTFSWVESAAGRERRRFEVDFESGRASSVVTGGDRPERKEARLDLRRGLSFTGYGTALAAAELPLNCEGAHQDITLVAFTPAPRAVTLEVRRIREETVPAAGNSIASDLFTLHPKLPFPVRLFVHPSDAHLWFTHHPPRALVRAEIVTELVAKDDPLVVVDVTPRGAAAASR